MSSLIFKQIAFEGQQLVLGAGASHDVAAESSIIAIVASEADSTITGLVPFEDSFSAFIILGNISANTITIPHNDSGSTETCRFQFIGGTVFTMLPGQCGIFFRDPAAGWFIALPGTLS